MHSLRRTRTVCFAASGFLVHPVPAAYLLSTIKLILGWKEMPDLLVNLLRLPTLESVLPAIAESDVVVRRAQPFEITTALEFVEREFFIA
jgi:hypothetical protein